MYLDEAQLTFYQKVCITRAYAPTSHDRYEWGMMIFINTMRNKIAHRSRHKNLQFNVSQLRKTMRETSENLNAELASVSDKEVLVYAAAVCSGFLLILEEQLARHKGIEMDDCD